MNRLKSSNYAVNSGAGWDTSVGTFNTAYNYDLNGNLTDLTRNGPDAGAVRVIDQLDYTYQGNQLQYVEDAAGWEGFKDGHAGTSADPDYGYDENGNLTRDLNKDITEIQYNYLNLPERVTKADGRYIKYIYDAEGIKLAQEVYDTSDNLIKKTEYIGEFIYETDADGNRELQLIQHEEGRIVPDEMNGGWEYQYKLADHLGNTRVMFTTKPKTWTFDAGFESENATDEESTFDNVAETRVTFNSADANSDGGNEVVQVNNAQPMGAGLSLPVGAGDTLSMEAYAYYEGGSGYNTDVGLATFIGAVAGGFGGINGGTEAQQATYDAFNNAISGIGFTGTSDDLVPAAFLNYILFDENMVYYQHGYVQISSDANMNHERISLDNIVADKQGFVFIYLSNESDSPNPVFFDDLQVTLKEHPVIQKQDYYSYGMEMAGGYQRITAKNNDFKYNNFEEQTELGWNVYDYQARYYDPAIGRFLQVDPAADLMRRHSPYNYAFDNPLIFIDPDGMVPEWINNGDGSYTAEDGDSAWTLAEDADISFEEAKEIMASQGMGTYVDSEDGVEKSAVDAGDVVVVPEQREACEQECTQQKTIKEIDNLVTSTEAEKESSMSAKQTFEKEAEQLNDSALDIYNSPIYKEAPGDPKGGITILRMIKGIPLELEAMDKEKQADSVGEVIKKLDKKIDSLNNEKKKVNN